MLSKRLRLPIQSVTTKPSRNVRAGGLTLKAFTTDLPYGRFGVIIPKATAKTAVLRNRLKRVAFDVFSSKQDEFKGRDVLCIVSKGGPLTKDAMISELSSLLSTLLRSHSSTS